MFLTANSVCTYLKWLQIKHYTLARALTDLAEEITLSVHPDTGVSTRWRREWSGSSRHACSWRWVVPRCTSTTRRAGGWTWTGCGSGMAVTTASPSTTSSRASERPASYTSEKNILISTHESVTHVKKKIFDFKCWCWHVLLFVFIYLQLH